MMRTRPTDLRPFLILALLSSALLLPVQDVRAQAAAPSAASPIAVVQADRSAKRAFALSLLVPGLGHRYVQHGSWRGAATLFGLIDAGLWAGLIGGEWNRGRLIDSYETLAATRADALVDGKGRTFFLNLATYRSSDEYRAVSLRNRAWEQIDYVDERAFQWEWATEEDFNRFRSLREDAESLRRRRAGLITALVANRLIAGITAARAAGRADDAQAVQLSVSPGPAGARTPTVHFGLRF